MEKFVELNAIAAPLLPSPRAIGISDSTSAWIGRDSMERARQPASYAWKRRFSGPRGQPSAVPQAFVTSCPLEVPSVARTRR